MNAGAAPHDAPWLREPNTILVRPAVELKRLRTVESKAMTDTRDRHGRTALNLNYLNSTRIDMLAVRRYCQTI